MTHIWKYKLILPVFAASIFLSAFLLFAVQPLFAKMILPQLGGAPAVWSVAMVFFQTMLLLGYLYAHVIIKYVPETFAALIHVIVTGAAFLCLPIVLYTGFGAPPNDTQVPWLLGVFAVSIGAPFFALSANGPLLQAWFARSGHPQAQDPYFLYSSSNIGSLLALLLYPVVFEPNMTLLTQSRAWTLGYSLLFACLLLLGIMLQMRARRRSDMDAVGHDIAPTAWQRGQWTWLAFAASGLLVAVTAHISTDVAAVPFLWIAPLVLYLLTFIIAFARRPIFTIRGVTLLLPFSIAPLLLLMISGYHLPWPLTLFLHLAAFFMLALLCHLKLAEDRPPAARLTEFYFFLSLGGVLGGIFAGLIAPYIFKNVTEYPLLIIAALLALPGLAEAYRKHGRRDALFALGALIVAAAAGLILRHFVGDGLMWVIVLVIVGTVLLADRQKPFRFVLLAAGALFLLPYLQTSSPNLVTHRSFFGVHKVYDSDDGKFRILQHGTTIHGAEAKDATKNTEPLTYYAKANNFGQALDALRRIRPLQSIGAVGLGTGSLACHLKDGERIVFFEIDPVVVNLAQSEFNFVKNCAQNSRITLGDARLTVSGEADGAYDIMIVDAFTSDAVPVHLLTQEALKLYFSKLKPDGIVLMHISNRNLEMRSMIATSAEELGYVILSRKEKLDDEMLKQMITPSEVVVLARKMENFGSLPTSAGWSVPAGNGVAAWRDDYSDIFSAMMRRLLKDRYAE